jgi:hypothetical protein
MVLLELVRFHFVLKVLNNYCQLFEILANLFDF